MEKLNLNEPLTIEECQNLRASYDKEEQVLTQNLRAVHQLQALLTQHIEKLCAEAEKISPEDVAPEKIEEPIADFNRRYPRSENASSDDEDF